MLLDRNLWRSISQAGIWLIPVPSELGGSGQSWTAFGRALLELGRKYPDLGLLLSLVAHAGLIHMVRLFGDGQQQADIVPWLTAGSCIGATAITEPGGGSDLRAMQTIAVPDGDGYLITGRKCHITNAPVADAMLVVARVDGTPLEDPRRIGLFLFERGKVGARFSGPEAMVGHRSSPTGGVTMEAMPLGRGSLLGRRALELNDLYRALALDRALYTICAVAVMESALEHAIRRTTHRRASGRRLIEHQYVQRHVTDIIIHKEMAELAGFKALEKLDAGADDLIRAASIAKWVGSDGLLAATQACMWTHGHEGYVEGPVSGLVLDALGSWFAAGTNDIQRLSILKQELKRRREGHA